ncbi:hypothetical protein DB31_8442 [Hyalangium minutum]|uniref:Uncharacterized protein n=1 Tax=Hyalangium minutum TaxID=394096 RepID=A0A085WHC6_9BACT|nr:hypothetical protein DB31_8442 [Hyalangium minutum]
MGRAVVVGADGTEGPVRDLAVTVRVALVVGTVASVAAMAAVAGAMDRDGGAAVAVTSPAPVGLPSESSPS